MGIRINTNTQSIFAQRALSKNTMMLNRSVEKLSTGLRINRAADDAAGLTISEKMTAEVKGLKKAKQNSLDGISLLQTAEGGLSVIQENLQRIRELVVQGSNGTNGQDERNAMQREINERVTTIADIAGQTQFNQQNLLDGTAGDITLQTGAYGTDTTTLAFNTAAANTGIDIDVTAAAANGNLAEGSAQALNDIALGTGAAGDVASLGGNATDAGTNLDDLDFMLGNISRMRSYLGAAQNSLESKIDYLGIATENVSASQSRIKDVDVASESSELTKNQILQQSASAMLGQANSAPQIALNLLP